MKKRYIVRAIAFLGLTAFIWSILAGILVNKFRNQNSAGNPEAKDADIVFIGTSQGALGINPVIMWDTQGVMAYNFSGNGQYIGITYYVLQDILENFTPQVIALDIKSVIDSEDFWSEGNLLYQFTVISDPLLRYQMYEEIIGQDTIYLSSLLRYHERWKEITSDDFEKKEYVLGAELYTNPESWEAMENLPQVPDTVQEGPPIDREMDYLEKIIALAESKGCKVVLLRLPHELSSVNEANFQKIVEYGGEKGIEVCDMMTDEFYSESGLQPEDFRDLKHLNIEGADKLSAWLGKYLVENDYVCDRRQDDMAKEWEIKVEKARREAGRIHLQMKTNFHDYFEELKKENEYETVIALSESIPEDMLHEVEMILGVTVKDSDGQIFWLKKGVVTVDDAISNGGFYCVSPSTDISCQKGEIYINSISAKKVESGVNLVVIDTKESKIIDMKGFDLTSIMP